MPDASTPPTAAAPEACATGACAPAPAKKRSVFMMGLLCAHCTLTLLVPLIVLVLGIGGAYLGLPLTWIVPPFFLAGAFVWLIWPSARHSWAKLREGRPASSAHVEEPRG